MYLQLLPSSLAKGMGLLGVGAISEEVLGAAANSCLEEKLAGTECFANVSFLGINQL